MKIKETPIKIPRISGIAHVNFRDTISFNLPEDTSVFPEIFSRFLKKKQAKRKDKTNMKKKHLKKAANVAKHKKLISTMQTYFISANETF